MVDFDAFAFRQSDKGPVIVSFVAPSHSIDEWAKVPTRLSNRQAHFQRAEIHKHVQEITNFFKADDTKENSSPTSILVGVDQASFDKVSLLDPQGKVINYAAIKRSPVLCKLRIAYEPWDSSKFEGDTKAELASIFPLVRPLYVAMSSDNEDDELDDDEPEDDLEETEASDEASDDQLEPNNPDEPLSEEADQEESEEEFSARAMQEYFARTSPKELISICDEKRYQEWPAAKQAYLLRLFKDELKPCLIIDGQHRVKGTSSLPTVPFMVAMLPNANWGELAFQFIVNNSSAQRVDENLLFGIVGQSLSADQLAKTETRLNKSGIKVSLIKAAMRVQLDPNPFMGMLKTNTPGEKGFLDAKAMQKKVIEQWYGSRNRTGTRSAFKKIKTPNRISRSMGEIFSGACSGANSNEKAQNWQEDHWFKYFKAFWEAVREHFEDRLWPKTEAQWLPTNTNISTYTATQREMQKLMRATVLGLLQSALLQVWADFKSKQLDFDGKSFKDVKIAPQKFKGEIANFIKRMPDDFFTALTTTGFDASKQTRERLLTNMVDILDGNIKMPELKAKDSFYQ